MNRLSIDTGTPRSVQGHVVSGALASGAIAGALNYNRYTKKEISKNEAIYDTLKLTLQGGIATSSAIAAANFLGEGKLFKMANMVSLGVFGIYALEKIDETVKKKYIKETLCLAKNKKENE